VHTGLDESETSLNKPSGQGETQAFSNKNVPLGQLRQEVDVLSEHDLQETSQGEHWLFKTLAYVQNGQVSMQLSS
jgi:hypothetical protein